jgi:hypothetical protein
MTSHRQSQIRPRAVLARGAALAACAVFAAACGSAAAPGPAAQGTGATGQPGAHGAPSPSTAISPGTDGSAAPAPAGAGPVNLTVSIAGSKARHWSLQCDPAGGNVADPQSACHRLLTQRSIFSPPAHNVMCPQIMSDAPAFLVSGTFLGQKVHETIQAGGCDLGKWSVLHKIFQ